MGRCANTLDFWDLWGALVHICRTAKRNGMLASPLLGGKIIAALDGIETYKSYHRGCEACSVRHVTIKKNDEQIEVEQFYHRYVTLALMGEEFPLPLGVWPILPGEDEVKPATVLLQEAVRRLGTRFFDVLVADALYLQAPFVDAVRDLGKGLVITLKDNQPCLLKEALQATSNRDPDSVIHPKENQTVMLWDAKDVWWDAARRSVRVVRAITETIVCETKTAIDPAPGGGRLARMERRKHIRKDENIFAAILDFRASAEGIYRAGKSRWDIDASLFQDLTVNWGLKHMKVHKPLAAFVLVILLMIAYALFMFFAIRHILARIRAAKPSFLAISRCLAETARSGCPP